MNSRLRLAVFLVIAAAITVTAGLVFPNLIRQFLAYPIQYLTYLLHLAILVLGEGTVWAILVIVILIVMVSWIPLGSKRNAIPNPIQNLSLPAEEQRIHFWAARLKRARNWSFSRQYLALDLKKMLAIILSNSENLSPAQVEKLIHSGDDPLAESVANTFVFDPSTNRPAAQTIFERTKRFWQEKFHPQNSRGNAKFDREVDQIIHFMEKQLEIPHDDPKFPLP